ncbi:Thiamine-phosphate synthase [subsurface metagenome]
MNPDREVLRILDANLNRASEGLRVIEDGVRFILNERDLTRQIREIRHSLMRKAGEIPGAHWEKLIASREVGRDVGKDSGEEGRENFRDLIRANFRRVQEAQRSLEEFGKLFSPALGQSFKELRFKTYSLEKKVRAKLRKRIDLSLYVIAETKFIPEEDFEENIEKVVSNGATVIQLREKNLPPPSFLKIALRMRGLIRPPILFIVNDRVDIAMASRADGVHLGQEDFPLPAARRVMGEEMIIGVSTHSLEEALRAEREGADYVAIGPLFPTSTKLDSHPPVGTGIIGEIKKELSIPVVAIGGITAESIEEVLKMGADGIAVVSAIFGQEDVDIATRRLSQKIRNFRKKKQL